MISLDSHKAKHINLKSIELIELVESFDAKTTSTRTTNNDSSISNKIATDLSNKVVLDKPYYESSCDMITGEKLSITEVFAGRNYGFNEQNFVLVKNLVELFLKEKTIENLISSEFLLRKILEWIFRVYNKNQITEYLTDFILTESREAIKPHDVCFPVEMLEITGRYEIGKASLLFMAKDYIDALERAYIANEAKIDDSYFKFFRDSYQGGVFIVTSVQAEYEKAIEIAFEECSLSIDILKICSITTNVPEYKLPFDIDKRVKGKRQSEFLVQDNEKPYYFILSKRANANIYILDKNKWELANYLGIGDLHSFVVSRNNNQCELSVLVVNSIKRFANAMSETDLNQRIVEIYTIFESLLIKDETVSILDNLTKYCSKLVTKDLNERKEVINLLKDMYKVRSSLIHHGIKKSFAIENLRKLQLTLLALLQVLILKLDKHKTKFSILNEIDDAILNAY